MSINGGMFTSKTDLWEMPKAFFDALDAEFHFDLDVCALPENAKCSNYYTPEQNGLLQPWEGCCWCNPPYGRAICAWVKKAAKEQSTAAITSSTPANAGCGMGTFAWSGR